MCITHVVASSTHQNASDTWRAIINSCAVVSLKRTVMNMPFSISLLTFLKSWFINFLCTGTEISWWKSNI